MIVEVLQQIQQDRARRLTPSLSHTALWLRSQENHALNTLQAFQAQRRLPRDSVTQEEEPKLQTQALTRHLTLQADANMCRAKPFYNAPTLCQLKLNSKEKTRDSLSALTRTFWRAAPGNEPPNVVLFIPLYKMPLSIFKSSFICYFQSLFWFQLSYLQTEIKSHTQKITACRWSHEHVLFIHVR